MNVSNRCAAKTGNWMGNLIGDVDYLWCYLLPRILDLLNYLFTYLLNYQVGVAGLHRVGTVHSKAFSQRVCRGILSINPRVNFSSGVHG